MNSYWLESVKQTQKEFLNLKENKKVNVCVIGGGLTGLTTSYYLSKTNLKVALLEKSRLCSHTSRKFYCKNYKPAWLILHLFITITRRAKSKTIL